MARTLIEKSLGNPFWEKSNKAQRKEKRREKNNEFSGHFVCHAARLQRRTGSACTSLGPIFELCFAMIVFIFGRLQ